MRVLSLLFVVILLSGCQKEEETVDTFNYSGYVFSYEEEPGSDVKMSEVIFEQGQGVPDVELTLKQIEYGFVGGSCCWSTRTGSKTLCNTVTDNEGFFECTLSEKGSEIDVDHEDYRYSNLINIDEDNRYVLLFNKTKVAINVIDTLPRGEDGIDIYLIAGHRSHAYAAANFEYNEGELIDGVRYSTDTISVMQNVNMNLSIKRDGEWVGESKRFFTGNSNDIQTLTIYK